MQRFSHFGFCLSNSQVVHLMSVSVNEKILFFYWQVKLLETEQVTHCSFSPS